MTGFPSDANTYLTTKPLVKEAVARGRWVTVTTYVEGETPVVGNLLFETEQDAQTFAQFLSCARVAVLTQAEKGT